MTDWEAVLDDLEARVVATEEALDDDEVGVIDLPPFEPPDALGPLPAELTDRAVDILRRQAETEKRLETAMASLRRELAKATQASSFGSSSPYAGESPAPSFFNGEA